MSIQLLNSAIDLLNSNINDKGRALVKALCEFDEDTQHSVENFVYIGWRAEHLPEFKDCQTFWLSPRKIMSLEDDWNAPVSYRNQNLLKLWIAAYGWNKEFQVSFNPQTGWCSLIGECSLAD